LKGVSSIINLIRVRQWYKNIIIFLPLVFGFQFLDFEKFIITCLGFIALSLVSSAMYVRNDIKDLELDRIHPLKKSRPLPSGLITIKQAWLVVVVFVIIGLGLSGVLDEVFFILLVLFIINTEIYSRWTRNIIFLDAFSIGGNFIIRAISGIVIIDSPLSPWLILGVFFVSLFLTFIKRKGEFQTLKEIAKNHRKSLKDYTDFSLNSAVNIFAIMVIITYSLYVINEPTGDWRLILTVPFVIFVILRQLYLSSINSTIAQMNEIFKDIPSRYAIIGFTILTIFLLYFTPSEYFTDGF